MRNAVRRLVRLGLFSLLISIVFGPGLARAQGSAGGSIGNDEKSLSGSREAPRAVERPARRSQPEADEPRRASRKGSAGGSNFDGAWMVYAVGVTCQGSGSNAVVITSGQIIGESVRGTVSPNGGVYSVSTGSNPITTTGRLSPRSGGGTFRRADGCTGTWTASKQ
jgi:hypothetical protein